jgi:hypothetical protein
MAIRKRTRNDSSNFPCPFSFGHCVVCPSSIYGFWLPLWHLQSFLVLFILAIVLSVLLPSMASDYLFDIFNLFLSFLFWPLCCLSFFHLWLLITSLVSSNVSCPFYFGHCVVCPSIYGFWLPLWHLQSFLVLFILAIVFSVLPPSMASDYLWHLQTFLVLFILAIVLSVLLPSMSSDYLFGIFKRFLSFLF